VQLADRAISFGLVVPSQKVISGHFSGMWGRRHRSAKQTGSVSIVSFDARSRASSKILSDNSMMARSFLFRLRLMAGTWREHHATSKSNLDRLAHQADHHRMTDDEIEAELATLTDNDVAAIWLNAADPEHPSRREEIALGEMERRNIDF